MGIQPGDLPDYQNVVTSPQVDLGSVASDGTVHTVALPTGAQGVVCTWPSGPPTRVTINGFPSNRRVADFVPLASLTRSEYRYFALMPGYDTSITVEVTGPGTPVELAAILAAQAVNVRSNPEDPVFVASPPAAHVVINQSLASAASLQLAPGALSLPHRLVRAYLSFDTAPANGFSIEDGAANFYWVTALAGPHAIDFGGLEANLINNVRLRNYAVGTIFVRGFFDYQPGA